MENKIIRPNIVSWNVAQLSPAVKEHFPEITDQELYAPYVVFTVHNHESDADIVFVLNGEDLYRITSGYLAALAVIASPNSDQILQ